MDLRPTRRLLGGALACFALTLAPGAAAQDDSAKLRDEAKKLLAAGKTSEACAKLSEAVELAKKSENLLELAQCHEKENKPATAVAVYKETATVARKERRYDREQTAKKRIFVLEPKLPKLTVTVAAEASGAEVTVDGTPLEKAQLGKPRPVDPGEHVVAAHATGKKSFESKVTLAASEKKTVAVPALAAEGGAAPATAAKPGAKPGDKPAEKPAEKPAAASTPTTAAASSADTSKKGEHAGGRFVLEAGAFAAFLFADFDSGELDQLEGLTYEVRRPGGTVLNMQCARETCEAQFESEIGLLIGGELFAGYAFTPGFQLGLRGFAAPRLGGGWMFAGGPAFSLGLTDRLWLGASFLVGAVQHTATVTEIVGKVPEDLVEINGAEEVPVQRTAETPLEEGVSSGIAFGGNLEISFALFSDPELGSLMVAAWPMALKGGNGLALAVPGGLAFRFH